MSRTIALNVDAGESFGAWSMGDAGAMFDLVTTMNVAAGFHAGDPGTIGRTFEPAVRKGVALVHAKMHGALSTHVAERSPAVADAIVAAGRAFDPALPLVVLPASELAAAAACGVSMARSGAYETPCIHGDNPDAVVIATALRQGLDRAGRAVAAA